LPAEAKRKWAEVAASRNPREKLQLMQEFLSLVPKHKGTAKLCAQVKKQMAVLRREIEEGKRRKAGKGGPKFFIEKEGAAQIVILGLTNVGKSSLLATTTNARVEVSSAQYTTKEPVPGMLPYEDIQFQLIEAPALMEGAADGRAWGLQTLALARNADGLILMVDLAQDPIEQISLILEELEKTRILVSKPKARVEIEKKFMGAGLRIIVFGKLLDCTFKEVEDLLKSYKFTDAVVKIYGEATLNEVEDAIFESTAYKSAIIIANKIDVENAEANLKLLEVYVGNQLPIVAVSCETGQGVERIGETLFKTLEIIRVYTKEPSDKNFSKKPFILKKGSTVYDLAKSIHSDFSEKFAYAKVWAKRLVFSPQKVGAAFPLEDGDVVEIHTK
jgi:ribosome-interacting GTPase 1